VPGRPVLLALLAAAGCSDADAVEALRNLGDDCLSCHRPGGKAAKALFTLGGTAYRTADEEATDGLGGVRLLLTGADGRRLELRANERGNFWSREPVAFPVAVEVWREGVDARRTVPGGPCSAGTCNGCHARPPKGGAPGRIYAPAR
jgi:hypothetical protein